LTNYQRLVDKFIEPDMMNVTMWID